jgi:NADH:ubiquinone oxidoreductase subunit 6 (subunit J)
MQVLTFFWSLLRFLLVDNLPLTAVAVLGLAAVYWLLPRPRSLHPLPGVIAAAVALVLTGWLFIWARAATPETVLFYAFSGLAILSGGLLVTQRNPVHAALSFALVVLSTCGLFLLLAAPFLMAATIIVYAGAIVVTFLFVIMLAQQAGRSDADHRSREPLLSCIAGFVLVGALIYLVNITYDTSQANALLARTDQAAAQLANLLERSSADPSLVADARQRVKDLADSSLFEDFRKEAKRHRGLTPDVSRLGVAAREAETKWDELVAQLDSAASAPEATPILEKMKEVLEHLREVGAQVRDTYNNLQPSGNVTELSAFSGPRANEPMHRLPRDAQNRVVMPADNVEALGRSLFTDYLVPVELGGTLLLVASVGAIAISGRRKEGLR